MVRGNSFGSFSNDGAVFPDCLLHQLLPDDHFLWSEILSIPRTGRTGFLTRTRLKHDCSLRGRDHFANELQQFALQGLRVARGIGHVRDLEECSQIARHSTYPRVASWQARA